MKKRIISILCAAVMTLAMVEPIFAADNSSLYTEFKNTTRSQLRTLFINNFTSFDISSDGKTYNDSQKSVIILDAYQKGFSSFGELNDNVTEAARKLNEKLTNPNLLGLSAYSSVSVPFTSPVNTDEADVFKIDGKEFIVLDQSTDDDGEPMFFVMAKDYYGASTAIISPCEGRWDDTNSKNLAYKLTNSMSFGNYNNNLPESILEHLDMLHAWNIEPSLFNDANKEKETVCIAPISLISISEYKTYGIKIGLDFDGSTGYYWTRTPVKSSAADSIWTIYMTSPSKFNANKTWGNSYTYLRPVFYLKGSFFKKEKMQKCGENVTAYVDKVVTESEIENLYSKSEAQEVFGTLTVEPEPVSGNAIVGQTLTTDYKYNGTIAVVNVDITWERSLDKADWEEINGATGKSYVIKDADAGYFIRAVFTPTFDSALLKYGGKTYAEKAESVYTSQNIADAVKAINDAKTSDELRGLLETHNSLFHCDSSIDTFSENAAKLFINDTVSSVDEIIVLYNGAIALDKFIESDDSNAKENAESEYLLGSIDEYKKLKTDTQKNRVILNLFRIDFEKVSDFIKTAKELIMLERFNSAERENIVSLIREYADVLGADISKLTNYQLEIVGAYVVGIDYGTDVSKLKSAIKDGINNAKKTSSPSNPLEGNTDDYSSGGFVPHISEKPTPSGEAPENVFSDLTNVAWAAKAINRLAQKGILSGNGDGTFSPDRLVTRNEFVKMIVTAFAVEKSDKELNYADIAKGSWSEEFIMAAVNAGIISGIDETHFGNGMNITRQDVAVISERVMQHKGIELKASSLVFDDSNEISDYAVAAVAKLNYCGIMNGLTEKVFGPKNSATRAMAAVVIYNLMNYYESQTKVEEEVGDGIAIKSNGDKYDILFRLGILKDEFVQDSKITRGELAAALTVLGNYSYTNGENVFSDVLTSHKYYKEIIAVYENNIMAGKTAELFAPDDTVTYKEAYEAIIAAVGYTNNPLGRQEAEFALNKEPVYAREDDALTADMAKKMLFAALEIPTLDIDSDNTLKLSEKNILNVNFDVYKEKGIVNVVSGMSIGGRGEYDNDKIIITVDSKDFLYSNDGYYDYSDYLGCKVMYYYKETEDSYQIINMMLADSEQSPIKLSFEQILTATKDLSSITYEQGSKNREAKISKSADFIYNGKRNYSISVSDLTPNNGYITLIDTDNDRVYDVVKIDNYEYIMVAQVDMKNQSILDKFSWQTYGFEEGEDAEEINITKNGRYIKMDYISQGDVIAIARSRDGKLMNAYVSDKKVTGRVQSVLQDDYEIQVANSVLKCVRDFNFAGIASNMSVTVGLDWNGYAVGYYTELSDSKTTFGYLYRLGENNGDDTLVYSILTQDNKFVALNQNLKLVLNDRVVNKADIFTAFSYNAGTITPQLIAYDLDYEGKIKKIYTSNTPTEPENSQGVPLLLNRKFVKGDPGIKETPEIIYNNFGMTFGFEYNLLSSGVLFNIAFDGGVVDKESSYVTNVGSKSIASNKVPEKFYVYNADESRVSRLCVYEHTVEGGNVGYQEGFNTQAFIISKTVTKYDEDSGDIITAFSGYHAGAEVEYSFSKSLLDEFDVSKICSGDVLLIWLSGDEIIRFRRLYAENESNAIEGDADLLCNYGDHDYTGEKIVRGGSNADYPYDWAQHVIERAEGRNGSATVGGTRWASLYGNIELVYKSEIYAHPVVRMKVAGKEESAGYTLDGSTKLYAYNTDTKEIRVLDGDGLNISSQRAVLTVRYGNVRDVIIYED